MRPANFIVAAVVGLLFAPADVPAQTTIALTDVLQVPASAGSPPLARINVLRAAPDGSDRMFVNDLRGTLWRIDNGAAHAWFDLAAAVTNFKSAPGLASGFVSFAFDPEYSSNGIFYTVHTEFVGSTPPNLVPPLPATIIQHSILTEWTASDPAADTFAGTSRELLRIAAPDFRHNMGEIAFNPLAQPGSPDYRLLYIGAGDYGSVETGAPEQLQRLDTVYGCILRIDPVGTPFMRNGVTYDYGFPAGNPYAADGDPDTWGELYACGVRNMHRLVWDSYTGALFGIDIGQGNFEEVNLVLPGANYGWPYREGNQALDPSVSTEVVFALPPDDATYGYSYPVLQMSHADPDVRAIAGGMAVRNSLLEELNGEFLFGDIVTGALWSASLSDMLAAADGDPNTVALVGSVDLQHASGESALIDVVADALGVGSTSRTDLRFGVGAGWSTLPDHEARRVHPSRRHAEYESL